METGSAVLPDGNWGMLSSDTTTELQAPPTPLLSRNHGHKVRLVPPGTKFPLQNLLSKVSRLGGRWDAGSDDPFTKKKAEA